MSKTEPKRLQFAAGQTVFREGDPSDLCYQIFSGRVQIVIKAGKRDKVVAELGPGEVFGEMGIIDDGPRSASAVASQDCVCIGYAPDHILEQIETNPATMAAIMKALITRLRDANRTISEQNPDGSLVQRLMKASKPLP